MPWQVPQRLLCSPNSCLHCRGSGVWEKIIGYGCPRFWILCVLHLSYGISVLFQRGLQKPKEFQAFWGARLCEGQFSNGISILLDRGLQKPKEFHAFCTASLCEGQFPWGISMLFDLGIKQPKEFVVFFTHRLVPPPFSYGISILFDVISKGSRNNMLTRWMLHGLNAANPWYIYIYIYKNTVWGHALG